MRHRLFESCAGILRDDDLPTILETHITHISRCWGRDQVLMSTSIMIATNWDEQVS